MIVVGITGNLATGKTAVTNLFKKHGAVVFDADRAARKAIQKGKPTYRALVKLFGSRFLTPRHDVDRRRLARHVFSHPEDLRKLNILIHPGVIVESLSMIDRQKKRKGILALDVPLLFESKMADLADYTVVVRSTGRKMLARAKQRGMPSNLAKKILASQWPIEKKARLADFVIDNNGTTAELEKKVKAVIGKILENEKSRKI